MTADELLRAGVGDMSNEARLNWKRSVEAHLGGIAQGAQKPTAWRVATPTGYLRDGIFYSEGEAIREAEGYWQGRVEPLYAAPQPASNAYSAVSCGAWQDIETAPQDGNPVIVWDDPVLGEAYYDTGEKSWWWANTGPGDYTAEAIYPTLWRPMPAGPSVSSTRCATPDSCPYPACVAEGHCESSPASPVPSTDRAAP